MGDDYAAEPAPPDGTVMIAGNLELPTTTATADIIQSGANRFIHSFGNNNFFAGVNAGNLTMTGTGANTGVGVSALTGIAGGTQNTAVGWQALASNTAGPGNTAVGSNALRDNVIGASNVAIGLGALTANKASGNTAVGHQALARNIASHPAGSYNTAIGYQALYENMSASNTAVGSYAGGDNAFGTGNVFPGFQAGKNTSGSNQLFIANSDTTAPLIYGNFSEKWVRISGRLEITSVLAQTGGETPLTWKAATFAVGSDLAEFFPAPSGHLGEGSIAALGADGNVVAAKEGAQTLGPTPYLPGINMDGAWQKIGPGLEDMRVPGKTPVALLGRVTVEVEGPVQAGDVLIAGPAGKAIRWQPGKSALSYVGLVVEVNPKARTATVLVGHQGLQRVLDSIQAENNALKDDLEALKQKVALLEKE